MAGGDLSSDAPICMVGFRALKDFHPALAADTLSRAGVSAREASSSTSCPRAAPT